MQRILTAEQSPSSGLWRVDIGAGRQLFSVRTLRNPTTCGECGEPLPAGTRAYGEALSQSSLRKYRYCISCIEANAQ